MSAMQHGPGGKRDLSTFRLGSSWWRSAGRKLFIDSQLAFRGAKRDPSGREYKLLSLDVFDTCLIRDFVSQESLWYLLGRDIVDRLPGISSPAEFVRLRERAESDARIQCAFEDITLVDVYTGLASMCGWDLEQQRQAIAIEEALEFRGLGLNPAVRDLLARAHTAPVSYLSDTPHRGAFIRSCLDTQSLPTGQVLSSGDLGLRKGTGSLFREAIKRFGVGPNQMLHVGNDLRIDGLGSAIAGVAFAPMLAANPTRYEVALDSATRRVGGLLGAGLAGVSREFRLARADHSPSGLVSIVSGVAGPVIFAGAAWALLSAQQDNIDVLYFAARDGEILLAVAQLLQQKLGLAAEMECRYLYGSRRAWYLPGLGLEFDTDPAAALRRLLVRSHKENLRGLLSMLDVSVEEVAAVAPETVMGLPPDIKLGDRRTAIIDALVNSPDLQSLALERAKKARETTAAYLAQEKMFSSGRVGLVDIGWHGAAAASLAAIASEQGTDVSCYFTGGLCGREARIAPKGSRAFLIDTRSDEEAELDLALIHLLETFCAGSGGSTLGYIEADGQYLPRLAPAESNAAMRWGLRDYQALVCSYAANACRALTKFEWTVNAEDVEALRPYLIANLRTLWSYPTYDEAEMWGTFPFEGDNSTCVLARVITVRDFVRYLLHFVKSAKNRNETGIGIWKRAAIARTIGGRRLTDPLMLLQVMSQPRGRGLRILARSKFSRRPMIRLADVKVRDGRVIARRLESAVGFVSANTTVMK